MRTFAQKPKAPQQATPAKSTTLGRAIFGQSHEVNSILHLQRTIGNQVVQRLLQASREGIEVESSSTAPSRFLHDFSRIPVYSKVPVKTQTKQAPVVSEEQQASASTFGLGKIMVHAPSRRGNSFTSLTTGNDDERMFQTAVGDVGTAAVQRKCAECNEEEMLQKKSLIGQGTTLVQSKAAGVGGEGSATVQNKINTSKGTGQPLSDRTRNFMQSGFGTDFSEVSIHTGGEASLLNKQLGAKAFTVGNDIYFSEGQYNPESSEGKHLLAHELTHTLQQGNSGQSIQRAVDCPALGGRVPTSTEEVDTLANFPNLVSGEWCILGPRDSSYNCHAYSAGRSGILSRATIERVYGDGVRPLTESEMDAMYMAEAGPVGNPYGSSDAKVALFTDGGVVKHSAKLINTPQGSMAESKLGGWELILHPLFQLERGAYGNVTRYYY